MDLVSPTTIGLNLGLLVELTLKPAFNHLDLQKKIVEALKVVVGRLAAH